MPSSDTRIAALGECMIELADTGDGQARLSHGGDSLNTSVYLARLGAQVDYLTALGDDPYSDAMLAAWTEAGVGIDLVRRLPGRLPGLYAIRTDAAGERAFYYWRSAAAARDMLRQDAAPAPMLRALGRYGLIYLTGVSLSILDRESRGWLYGALDRARAGGARVAFDSNYRPRGWPDANDAGETMRGFYGRVDIALPTHDDEAVLYGDPDAEATLNRLESWGVAEIAVKDGARTAHGKADGKRWTAMAKTIVTPLDTTAAGDAFNAAYLAARLDGATPEAAAWAGHRLAGEVIQHRGAIIPPAAMPDKLA